MTHPRNVHPTVEQGPKAIALHGQWTAPQVTPRGRWQRLAQALEAATASPLAWDLRAVDLMDHLGAQLIWQGWGQRWPQQLDIDPRHRQLIARVAELQGDIAAAATAAAPGEHTALRWPANWGAALLRAGHMAVELMADIGQFALDVLRLLRRPDRAPWRDISGHIYRMGATALPITALVGFLIGVVLAYLMGVQLRMFGADTFIVNLLGIAILRELGPLLAAILVAGRSGSAITAQLGVMRVTKEMDALAVLGISRSYRLVMPRVLALALSMPLVGLWTSVAALLGGMVAAYVSLGVTPAYFFEALPQVVRSVNLWLGLGKSVVFGVAIALIGSYWGMRVQPNTKSLGEGTTASVVMSITSVILIDALFAILFRRTGFVAL